MSGRSFQKKGGATPKILQNMPKKWSKKESPMSEDEIAAARKKYELRMAQKTRLTTARILK